MLQKGFLKSRYNEGSTRVAKTGMILFLAGVVIILGNFFGMMAQIQKGEQISILFLIIFIIGFFMLTVSLWTKFFVQNKVNQN